MLILDKQRAVDRIVALTGGLAAVASEEAAPKRSRGRGRQRIATYERRAPGASGEPDIAAAAPPPPARRRTRTRPAPAPM